VSQIVRAQAGGRKVKAGVKSVSTDNWAGAVQPGIAWTGVQAAWPVNPADSAAWEEADLASLQVGAKVAAP
jgi:hypothetical protein